MRRTASFGSLGSASLVTGLPLARSTAARAVCWHVVGIIATILPGARALRQVFGEKGLIAGHSQGRVVAAVLWEQARRLPGRRVIGLTGELPPPTLGRL